MKGTVSNCAVIMKPHRTGINPFGGEAYKPSLPRPRVHRVQSLLRDILCLIPQRVRYILKGMRHEIIDQ
jgi:hypothetical protein